MAGQLAPVVMIPRYSAYTGADTFTTVPIEVSRYDSMLLSVWRSPLIGTSPTFTITFEQSMDQQTWSTITVSPANTDPGADAETQYSGSLTKRWFRVKIVLGGTNPVATCYVVGAFVMRE